MSDEAQPPSPAEALAARQKRVPRWRRMLPLFGLVLLGWALSRVDFSQMGHALDRVSLTVLLLSGGSFSINYFIKAFRWHRMLLAQGLSLPRRVTLAAFLSGTFYGQVTLGRVGELFRVEALIERGASVPVALASSILDRLIDVFVVMLVAAVLGAFVVGNIQIAGVALAIMLAAGLGTWLFLSALGSPNPAPRVTAFFDAITQVRFLKSWHNFVKELAGGMYPMAQPRPLFEALVWTIAGWFFYLHALYVLADGLGIHVARTVLTTTAALAALSALLPVTVSGLGARELIYIEILKRYGVQEEPAVLVSLLHLFIMTISATGFGFLGVLWRSRQQASSS